MASDQPLVPAEHASGHVLIVPATTSAAQVAELGAAWFDGATWLTPPRTAVAPPPSLRARFRGLRRPAEPSLEPAVLRVGVRHRVAGPFDVAPVRARTFGFAGPAAAWVLDRLDGRPDVRGPRPASSDDPDGIARAFAAGLPEGDELQAVLWAVAVARRVGGTLIVDGQEVLRPDPAAGVDLTLWTSQVLAPAALLAAVRTLVATAQPAAEDGSAGAAYRVVATTPYDGTAVADVVRADNWPRAVVSEQGRPVAYRVRWVPQDADELLVEQPSGVHVIARARMRVLHARLVQELQRRAGGTVLDDDGFVVTAQALEERLSAVSGARAWV